ncbi:MAG: TIM barrel protein [Candidatus Peribacteraceae bacterium]|jgi:deoxyribonuclease-4|nr:TIM barrel protein [Candidatus Peribacteraceae bacterium]MDP7454300.1 TIM barrel protein [Candidatus Peribacteraceae bacterium]MDP7645660.1 TIM barrel protein [Candidatus Peribacteraceae bacterium]|tara:strand:+ start:5059 stop:5886 length:828 start_codon:yes stop_codon:yes gene_type:complete
MLHFAVAGSPLSTPAPGGTVEGIKQSSELGINALEIEWVQRVPDAPKRMAEIKAVSKALNVTLTVHAPYFVNLNAKEPEKLEASKKRILKALEMAELAGAKSVCVHPAFYLGMEPDIAFTNVQKATAEIMQKKPKLFPSVNLAYETMGKGTQFGTLEEVLKISKEFDIYPCVDIAHLHARTNGGYNSTKEFNEVFDVYEKYLGKKSLKNMHLHYSGIEYTAKGERRHLVLKKSDAKWKEYLKVLKKRQIEGVLVCESPNLEEDTILLQNNYAKLA